MRLTRLLRFKNAFFCLVLTTTAQADWTIVSNESEPGRSGVVHRNVVLENSASSERVAADLAIFSTKSCTLRVRPGGLLRRRQPVIARWPAFAQTSRSQNYRGSLRQRRSPRI